MRFFFVDYLAGDSIAEAKLAFSVRRVYAEGIPLKKLGCWKYFDDISLFTTLGFSDSYKHSEDFSTLIELESFPLGVA